MKLLASAFQNAGVKVVRGHPRSKDAERGQNLIFSESGQIIPQSEALQVKFP